MSKILKEKAITLRRAGNLYSHIAKDLGVPKTTVYSWTKRLALSEAESVLVTANLNKYRLSQINKLAKLKKLKQAHLKKQLQTEAKSIVEKADFSIYNKTIHCSVFFWCEGGKDERDAIKFINSDPSMIQAFLTLLRATFQIDENKFRALVHLHEYHDEKKQIKYWSKVTSIPLAQFHKSYLKPNSAKNTREGYPGCISIRYHDASLGKLLKMIYIEFGDSINRGVR